MDYCVKEKMDILSSKIISGNQFPTGNQKKQYCNNHYYLILDNPVIRCFKVLCGILNDSWKHYICFYPEVSYICA